MSAQAINEFVYSTLDEAKEELGATAVYVQGDVAPDAELPYITYIQSPAIKRRVSNEYGIIRRTVQIDVVAASPDEAETMGDDIEALMVGQGVAASESSSVFGGGFELREGTWRTIFAPQPVVDNERVYRTSILLQQDEALAL
jgi:hypothetical protein